MRSIRSKRFLRPLNEGAHKQWIMKEVSDTHLSCPRWEILEGPPNAVFLLGLLDLFADPHVNLASVVKMKHGGID